VSDHETFEFTPPPDGDRQAGRGILVIPDTFRTAADAQDVTDRMNTAVATTTSDARPIIVQVPAGLMDRASDFAAAAQGAPLPEDLAAAWRLVGTGDVLTVTAVVEP
jgi:hypothetical protein